MKISYNASTIQYIALYDSLAHGAVKDCFELNETLYFIINPGMIGKAVGPQGNVIKKLERLVKRKLRVVEFNTDIIKFISSLVFPIKVEFVSNESDIITVRASDNKGRGIMIGRNAQNLRTTEQILKRFFPIKELKVE